MTRALTAHLGPQQGAAGHMYLSLVLVNHTTGNCVVDGYPGISFTAGNDAHQIGSPAQRDHRYPSRPVVLAPGASAHTTVAIAAAGAYDSQRCRLVQATGLRIYPPGSTQSMLVKAPMNACSTPEMQDFQTSVMRPGITGD